LFSACIVFNCTGRVIHDACLLQPVGMCEYQVDLIRHVGGGRAAQASDVFYLGVTAGILGSGL
jgi:hypothetical protein